MKHTLRNRTNLGAVRAIHVELEEHLYRRLDRYCDVASLTKAMVVSRGVHRMLQEAAKTWPPEYLQPELVVSIT